MRDIAAVTAVGLVLLGVGLALARSRRLARSDPMDFGLAARHRRLQVIAVLACVGAGLWAWLWFQPFHHSVTYRAVPSVSEDEAVLSTCNPLRDPEPGGQGMAVADAGYELAPDEEACVGPRADRWRLLIGGELVLAAAIAVTALSGRRRRAAPLASEPVASLGGASSSATPLAR